MERPPTLEVLLPHGRPPIAPDPTEAELTELYAYPEGPWLRAGMIATLDGAATGPDGRSGSINGPADLRVFTTARALADVVLVGAGTVRAEGYLAPRTRPSLVPGRRRRGQADHPLLAVVTRSGDLPTALLAEEAPPWVFTTAGTPRLEHLRRHLPPDRLHVHDGVLRLTDVVETLVAAGHRRLLAEGGPAVLADLVAEGLVDELCLTLSPLLVGGPAPRILRTAASARTHPVRCAHLLHADGTLLGRWLTDLA